MTQSRQTGYRSATLQPAPPWPTPQRIPPTRRLAVRWKGSIHDAAAAIVDGREAGLPGTAVAPIDMPLMNIAPKSSFVLSRRHLLGIEGLSRGDISGLLDLAEEFVELNRQVEKKRASLRGRTQINLFFEASTRTQASFELAGKRLGADVMNMSASSSSMRKGETLIDTAITLNAMHPDILVVRHHASGAVELLASKLELLGDQCRRRLARAPDAGAARRAHHPPQQGPHRGPDGRDLRRHPAFARRPLQHHPAQLHGRARARGRALDAAAARHRALRRRGRARHARGACTAPTS